MTTHRKCRGLLWLAPCTLLLWGSAATPQIQPMGPGKDFSSRTFNKDGSYATWLRAATARSISPTQIDATDVIYTIYASDSNNRVETLLTSPAATALSDQEVLHGDQTVKMVRTDAEVTGAQWSFSRRDNHVSIGRDARVVFHVALPDLLK